MPETPLRDREPVRFSSVVVLVVQNTLTLATSFGVELTQQQTGAVLMLTNSLTLLAGMVWTRRQVKPR